MANNERMRNYMALRYERRKNDAIKQLGGICVSCGSADSLEFDHIDPKTKKFAVCSLLAGVSEEKLQTELTKCQLLCGSCHKKKHAWQHGTLAGYRYCRCIACSSAKREYSRVYKASRRGVVVA